MTFKGRLRLTASVALGSILLPEAPPANLGQCIAKYHINQLMCSGMSRYESDKAGSRRSSTSRSERLPTPENALYRAPLGHIDAEGRPFVASIFHMAAMALRQKAYLK
jgi:hypothetical protein